MMGYLGRLQRLESEVHRFSTRELALWLQAINSDVLSAVEKRSLVVRMRSAPGAAVDMKHTIFRSERGFEGEGCLALLEMCRFGKFDRVERFLDSAEPLAIKLRGRSEQLKRLRSGNEPAA